MTIWLLAFVLMAHFGMFLGSLAFAGETGCTPDNLAACSGGAGLDEGEIRQEVGAEERGLTGIGFVDQTINFVSDMFSSAARMLGVLFQLFTFGYQIANTPEGGVGSGPVGLLMLFFRVGMSALQAYVMLRLTMAALGRG